MLAASDHATDSVSRPSDGWAIASLALLGLAMISRSLPRRDGERPESSAQFRAGRENAKTFDEEAPTRGMTQLRQLSSRVYVNTPVELDRTCWTRLRKL